MPPLSLAVQLLRPGVRRLRKDAVSNFRLSNFTVRESGAWPPHSTSASPIPALIALQSLPPQRTPRLRARHGSIAPHFHSVHEHVLDAIGDLIRLLKCRSIDDARRVEEDEIRFHPRLHEASIGNAQS